MNRNCLGCGENISHMSKLAKRCFDCANIHKIEEMRKYRETYKDKIKAYQKKYYGK